MTVDWCGLWGDDLDRTALLAQRISPIKVVIVLTDSSGQEVSRKTVGTVDPKDYVINTRKYRCARGRI